MNNHDQQDALLKEQDFIRCSIMLKPDQVDFLQTIDSDNMSKAVRIIIDKDRMQTKRSKMEHYLLLFMVLCIFILGVFQILLW